MTRSNGHCAAKANRRVLGRKVGSAFIAFVCSLGATSSFAYAQAGKIAQVPSSSSVPYSGYDVISIKPNASGSGSMRISARETTFQATNTSLKMMLLNAYGVRDALITGLPKWAESARWDINAKIVDPPKKEVDEKLSREQATEVYRGKVRSILADRFKLTAHKESKMLPTYELTMLPGPPRFAKSATGEEDHSGMNVHNRDLAATAISLKDFARFLSDQTDRTVIDKTGLEGLYNFSLKWSADELAEAAKETGTTDRPPEIHTALQEQLGLKLVSSKGMSEVLVVDSVEQPAVD